MPIKTLHQPPAINHQLSTINFQMKTRVGKIARLSYETREQLNLRLLNGELSSTVLDWLNELSETKALLKSVFAGKPISKQNLSEWRHGGYQDWLRHQQRQERFRHLSEQGAELEEDEGTGDVFENFSRIVLAEMAEDLNNLHEVSNRDKRWQRLREIGRELARLQHGYNHSRKTELSWDKWKSSYDYRTSPSRPPKPIPNPPTNIQESSAVKPGQTKSNQNQLPSGTDSRKQNTFSILPRSEGAIEIENQALAKSVRLPLPPAWEEGRGENSPKDSDIEPLTRSRRREEAEGVAVQKKPPRYLGGCQAEVQGEGISLKSHAVNIPHPE
jgi:hypothetical protein